MYIIQFKKRLREYFILGNYLVKSSEIIIVSGSLLTTFEVSNIFGGTFVIIFKILGQF